MVVTKINVYLMQLQVHWCIWALQPQSNHWACGTRASDVPGSPVGYVSKTLLELLGESFLGIWSQVVSTSASGHVRGYVCLEGIQAAGCEWAEGCWYLRPAF